MKAMFAILALVACGSPAWAQTQEAEDEPAAAAAGDVRVEEVTFRSTDSRSTIKGYVFRPATVPAGRLPAVVMMHGRSGAYSSLANGVYNASTLSRRHRAWGELWARNGYVAIMVDDFGPLGYPPG